MERNAIFGPVMLICFGVTVALLVAGLATGTTLSNSALGTLVTVSVSGSIIALLAVINFVSELRRLKRAGVPRPLYLIFQRSIALFIPASGVAPEFVKGQLAWVSWDVRWVAAGETMATVTDFVPERNEVTLELDNPLECCGTSRKMVSFKGRWPAAFGRKVVYGSFLPELDRGLFATGEVVIYPGHQRKG